ncbi:hypothetical protein UlMin_009400 [Ulmus minor]
MSSSQCCENPPTLSSTSGEGTVQDVGGLKAYVTGSSLSNRAILLASDVFGYEAPNLRALADKVAAAGFFVVVPDFLYSDPFEYDNPQFDRELWLKVHNLEKGCEDAKKVIAALKSKGVTAIGIAGFCWGGSVVLKVASSSDDIQAAVIFHPGWSKDEDITDAKVHIAILGAEIDNFAPPEQLIRCGEILSSKSEIDSFVKIFPGVVHGFSVRYSVEDEAAVKNAEEAHLDMLNWFTKYVN